MLSHQTVTKRGVGEDSRMQDPSLSPKTASNEEEGYNPNRLKSVLVNRFAQEEAANVEK